jgi:putative transposase
MIEALRKVIKRMHYPLEVMLTCVRWYAAYPLSLRHIEEMMAERGVFVGHATIHRWALKIMPALVRVFRDRKRSVGRSWRMDEIYIKIHGAWKYLYRAVDRGGDTVDFLLTARRDEAAARRFLERAIDRHGRPKEITIDKSVTNTAAINSYTTEHDADIEIRHCKYLNNIVEQDHLAIKRIVRPMLGFKSMRCARILLAGIETMHMIPQGPAGLSQRENRARSKAILRPGILSFGRQSAGSA